MNPPRTVHVAPKMEAPKLVETRALDTIADRLTLLAITRIPEAKLRHRQTKAGPIVAKQCSPGVLPYLLPAGAPRGAKACHGAEWVMIPQDLDKVPLPPDQVEAIIEKAFSGTSRLVWTTWSCTTTCTSARLMLIPSRPMTYVEACDLWWWVRRQLVDAGMPELEAGRADEPCLDPRAVDGKLFYLPAVPTPAVAGTEGWGGVHPRGTVGQDTDVPLDVDAVLAEARAFRAVDEPAHLIAFPGVPVPGSTGSKKAKVSKAKGSTSSGNATGPTTRLDMSTVAMPGAGVSVLAWIEANVGLGQETSIGSVFDPAWVARHPDEGSTATTARVHREADGGIWVHDFRAGTTYVHMPATLTGFSTISTGKKAKVGPRRVTLTSADLTPSGHVSWSWVSSVAAKAKASAIVLQLGLGLGKTQVAADLLTERRARGAFAGQRVVAVSPTRSLSRSLSARLGLPNYLDGEERGPLHGDVAVCAKSLHRVPFFRFDHAGAVTDDAVGVLVLDEIEQTLRGLRGSHYADHEARRTLTAIENQVTSAKLVLLMDADAGPLTEALLARCGRHDSAIWIDSDVSKPRNLVRYQRRATWLAALRGDVEAGMRVAVPCGSVAEAHTLAKSLALVNRSARVALITSETIERYDIGSINSWVKDYDVLIYTPVIGTGVSIDVRGHFDRVYAYCTDVGTADDLGQLIARVRHPKDTTIRAYGRAGRQGEAWERCAPEVFRRWVELETQTTTRLKIGREIPADLVTWADGRPAFHPDAESYAQLMALAFAADRCNGAGWQLERYVEKIKRAGGRVLDDLGCEGSAEERDAVEDRDKHRVEVEAEHVEAIVTAPDLDEKQIEDLRRRGPRTRTESDALRKEGVRRTYGEVSREVVAYDDRGRGRRAMRTYAEVLAVIEGGQAATTLAARDRHEVEHGVSVARLSHRSIRAQAIKVILGKLGLSGQHISEDTPHGSAGHQIDSARALMLATWAGSVRVRRALSVLGIRVRADAAQNPMQLVGNVLRRLGLELAVKREQVNGQRVRTYTIDADTIATMRAMSTHYLTQLRGGIVVADPTAAEFDSLDLVAVDPGLKDEDVADLMAMLVG